jgi:exosortase D (VPLPA-CTERM-specific)
MNRSSVDSLPRFRFSCAQLGAIAAVALTLILVFQNTFLYLYSTWQREEYSHGFLVPLVSAYLLWQRRDHLRHMDFTSSWAGVLVVVLGLLIYFLGSLASITTVDAYALVIVIAGCVLAVMGWEAFRVTLVPIALLFLMNPIPNFFYNNLSSQLQLISSQIGVALIRAMGVAVYLQGNVIDLGSYKLQVAEACSGLRYLFPLVTLGVIVAYLFRGRTWMRWTLVLSTLPITVLMNSFRIGVIGLLVDRWGTAQAEGFLHDFEGWVVFLICLALLFVECWALLHLGGDRRSLREAFAPAMGPEAPAVPRTKGSGRARQLGGPAVAVLLLLLAAAYPAHAITQRAELRPTRSAFSEFPLIIGGWHGRRERLESVYLDTLKLDDYVLANYERPAPRAPAGANDELVNLYVAYYASQRTGQSAHSPRSCLPGGGWRIEEFGQQALPGQGVDGVPLRVNRALIQQGASRQLVYYWFQQRGRTITDEYLVKWFLFVDALARNRTDGALVRLITPLTRDEGAAAADARLARFIGTLRPRLSQYVPD